MSPPTSTHIPGLENGRCDRLSRRGTTSSMTVRDEAREMGIDGGVEIKVNGDEEVMGLLRLCDPRRRLESDSDFIAFWTDVRDAVNNFVFSQMIQFFVFSPMNLLSFFLRRFVFSPMIQYFVFSPTHQRRQYGGRGS